MRHVSRIYSACQFRSILTLSSAIRPHFLPAFWNYIRTPERMWTHYELYMRTGYKRRTCRVYLFRCGRTHDELWLQVLGHADRLQDEYGIVELLRPDWDENGTMGKELCDWFDMQVEELRDFLLVHRLPYDIGTGSAPSHNHY